MLKIKINSLEVKPGDTFVAIKGTNVDGYDFIDEAISKGAVRIIANREFDHDIEKIIVPDPLKYLTDYLVNNYASEINKLNLIGITGTNGKTTTCFLIYQLLQKLGYEPAYIGTLGYYFQRKIKKLPNTTPNILDLYDMILESISQGCDTIVMEVSSHALELQRIAGLKFNVAAFTNLTQDHLDYHHTLQNYLQAKLKILNYLKNEGIMIVNNDDACSQYFQYKNLETISFNAGDFLVKDFKNGKDTTAISFTYKNQEYHININLQNRFNVYNYITAVACVHNLNISINDILKVSKDLQAPKGRCEQIKINEGLAVVDYAHTPDAVLKIIESFKEHKKGKIITIIGCGGDRDPQKRPIMGQIATENSDYVIFTNDNPRTENYEKIMADILYGVKKKNYKIVYDRRKAIQIGVDLIEENDVLLVLGKGHEDYQIIGTKKIHFDDMECLKEIKINLDKSKKKKKLLEKN